MVHTPFFSIIIPCYNAKSFIDKTLSALEQQTFTDFEVILVDDCSVDGTYEYLQHAQFKNCLEIILLQNEVNSGPGASRNLGLKHARGRYVGFCDSDDWYEPDLLHLVFQKIEKEHADLVFFDAFRCLSDSRLKIGWMNYFSKCRCKEDYIALSTDSLCSMVIDRSVFDRISIPNLYNAEDAVTVPLLAAQAEHISYIPTPLYNYLCRSQSSSTAVNRKIVDGFELAYIYFREQVTDDYPKAFEFHAIKLILYGWLYNAVRCGVEKRDIKLKLDEFLRDYPDWDKNDYIGFLPYRKRVWLLFVRHRFFILLKWYCSLHKIYLGLR